MHLSRCLLLINPGRIFPSGAHSASNIDAAGGSGQSLRRGHTFSNTDTAGGLGHSPAGGGASV